jgi:uncharacterized protein YkwD
MMPSRARLASASAAGVVGLAVAGMILFGTDPLGTGSAVTAVPAPAAASGAATNTETEPVDDAAAMADRRPKPTGTVSGSPRSTYKPASRTAAAQRPSARYGPRSSWRATRRPTARPRPTPRTAAPTMTAILPSPTPTRSSATRTATPTRSTTSPTPTTASPRPTTASPKPTSASPTSSSKYTARSDWAAAVLDRLNAQRASHGLPALKSNAKLAAAAHTHNLKIAAADQLSHQLPGEAGLGDRISAAGYRWSAVGENIAVSTDRSRDGVLSLQNLMYNDTPPNDGHRRIMLSSNFTEVGIDVIDDSAHGKVWLVLDFGRPS